MFGNQVHRSNFGVNANDLEICSGVLYPYFMDKAVIFAEVQNIPFTHVDLGVDCGCGMYRGIKITDVYVAESKMTTDLGVVLEPVCACSWRYCYVC